MKLKSFLVKSLLLTICLHIAPVAQAGECENAATNFKNNLNQLDKELKWNAQLVNTNGKLKEAKDSVAQIKKTMDPTTFKNFGGKIEAIKRAITNDTNNITTWVDTIENFRKTIFNAAENYQSKKCGCILLANSEVIASSIKSLLDDKSCINYCDQSAKSSKDKKTTCQFGPDTLKTYEPTSSKPPSSTKK